VTPAKKNFEISADVVEVIRGWREDPGLFVRQAFGAVPEPWQEEALKNLKEHDRLAIKSGHGVGKSTFLAWVIIWWLLTRYPGLYGEYGHSVI
jgi:superfamily II DNA or RNA helicase